MSKLKKLESLIQKALKKHAKELSALENVQGLGIVGTGFDGKEVDQEFPLRLAVYVTRKLAEKDIPKHQRVPKMLEVLDDGVMKKVKTKIIEQGEVSPQDEMGPGSL